MLRKPAVTWTYFLINDDQAKGDCKLCSRGYFVIAVTKKQGFFPPKFVGFCRNVVWKRHNSFLSTSQ